MPRILVIEDDDILRSLMRKMLARAGFEVVEAADGTRATEIYTEQAVDLVITDLFMPETEGMEVIRDLLHEDPQAKIIAISGGSSFDSIDYLEMALLIGAARTLCKPFGARELLQTVRQLLAQRSVTDCPSSPA